MLKITVSSREFIETKTLNKLTDSIYTGPYFDIVEIIHHEDSINERLHIGVVKFSQFRLLLLPMMQVFVYSTYAHILCLKTGATYECTPRGCNVYGLIGKSTNSHFVDNVLLWPAILNTVASMNMTIEPGRALYKEYMKRVFAEIYTIIYEAQFLCKIPYKLLNTPQVVIEN